MPEPIRLNMSVLTDENFETIKTAIESVLSDVGFVVHSPVILSAFEKAGALVDYANRCVRITPGLLWDLVERVPRSYKISGINGDTYEVGKGGPYKFAMVTDPFISDYPTGEMRKPRLSDVIRNTRIIQSRPDVCIAYLMDYPVEEIDGPASRYRAMEAFLLNHAKPIAVYPTSYKSFLEWLEIGHILTRGETLRNRGLISTSVALLSPLTLAGDNCDILLEAAKYRLPMIPAICPMAGATAPYTFIGSLVQGIAESLIVLCCVQVISPENPCLYGMGVSVADLKTGGDLYYTVDKFLWKIAANEFAKRLGLPVTAETGGAMSCRHDMQSGAEGMLMTLSALMSGADVLAGAGSCLNAVGLSSEFILTHYAFLDAAAHLKKGYPMSELDRSLDSIREQGCGGNFLTDDLTLEKLRDSEFFSHPLFDEACEHGGGQSMLDRAHEKGRCIDENFISPVPRDIADALRRHFDKICNEV